MRLTIITGSAIVIAIGSYFYVTNQRTTPPPDTRVSSGANPRKIDVVVPELVGNAKIGEQIFNVKCAACHGEDATGVNGAGPPLVHKIYEPSHHGDAAFLIAVRNGVRSHHWPYGNMPPVKGISDAEVTMVVDYVRTLQRENGIN